MKVLAIVLAASTLIFSTGCATLLKGSNESLWVTSNPEGARVLVNGMDAGRTPTTARVNGTKDVLVEVKKDGYESRSVRVTSSLAAGWLILDIILLPTLLPIAIDAITGDWKSLDETDVRVELEKK